MSSLLPEKDLSKVLMTSDQVKKALIRISHEIYEKNDDFENKYIIDHLDDNIFNYLPPNLEWVSHGENQRRMYMRGKR